MPVNTFANTALMLVPRQHEVICRSSVRVLHTASKQTVSTVSALLLELLHVF